MIAVDELMRLIMDAKKKGNKYIHLGLPESKTGVMMPGSKFIVSDELSGTVVRTIKANGQLHTILRFNAEEMERVLVYKLKNERPDEMFKL